MRSTPASPSVACRFTGHRPSTSPRFRYSRLYAFLALLLPRPLDRAGSHPVLFAGWDWLRELAWQGSGTRGASFAVALLTVAGYSVNDTVGGLRPDPLNCSSALRSMGRSRSRGTRWMMPVAVSLSPAPPYTTLTTRFALLRPDFLRLASTLGSWFAIALSVASAGSWVEHRHLLPPCSRVISGGPAVPSGARIEAQALIPVLLVALRFWILRLELRLLWRSLHLDEAWVRHG